MKFLNHNLFTGDITVNGTTTLSTATGITRASGDNSTHLATTAFVKAQGYLTAEVDTLDTVTDRNSVTTNSIGVGTINIIGTTAGAELLTVDGTFGRLFTVTDDLSDSLFSVNTIAGLPVIEVFADNTINLGAFSNPITIDGSSNIVIPGTITASGYNDTNWNTAYNDRIVSAAVSGTTTKTLTLTQTDGGTISTSWTDINTDTDGYISNVSLVGSTLSFTSVGSAFSGIVDLSTLTPTVRTVYETVKNVSGATILKGTPLAVVPGQTSGNLSDVIPADASDPAKMPAVFIANQNIADEAEGEAVLFGNLTGVNTELYESGTTVYVAPGGGWTADKPIWPNLIQNLGVITKQHPTNGAGIVTGVGRANALPNLTAGKIWVGSATYPIESTTVHIDEANGRVGIGTATPEDVFTIQEDSADFSIRKTNGDLSTRILQYGSGAAELRMYDGTATQTVQIAADTGRVSYINNGQNFGIGTTSPSTTLHVAGTARVTGSRFDLNSGTIITGQYYVNGNTEYTYIDMYNGGNASINIGTKHSLSYISFESGNGAYTERMRITNTGNVGIGTTSPAKKLTVATDTVNDGVYVTTSGGTSVATIGTSSTATSGALSLLAGGSTKVFISAKANENSYFNGGGNVGIGTTSPGTLHGVTYGTTKLHIDGGTDRGQIVIEGDSLAGIVFSDNGATANERVFSTVVNGGNYQIKPLNDNGTSTAGGAAITVLHNSNVGIGTTSPNEKLEVAGNIRLQNYGRLYLWRDNNSNYLDYNNWIANTGATQTIQNGGVGGITFKTLTDTRMFISSSGNIGIGTTSPAQKLHIVSTDGANIILNSNTGAENNGIWMTEGDVATPYANGAYVYYDSTNNAFKINTGTSSLSTRFEIARDTGAIKFNSYDSTNQTGTPTYLLGTDASGNIVKTLSSTAPGSLWTASGNDIYNTNSGDVVIGATSSNYKFGVTGGHIGVSNGGNIYVGGFGADAVIGYLGNTSGVFTLRSDGNRDISIGSGTVNDSIFIEGSNGNVGIGTTAPTARLHVEAPSSDGVPVFRANGTTAPNAFNYAGSLMNFDLGSSRNTILLIGKAQSNRDSGYIGFNHSGTNGSNTNFLTFGLFQNDNILNITGGGNVGIGTTSPSYKLDVETSDDIVASFVSTDNKAAIRINDDDTSVYVSAENSKASFGFNVGVNAGNLNVDSAGNVGIGTASPSYKLDVAGTISNNSEQNFIYATYDDVAALFQRVGTFGAVIKIGRKGVSNSTTIDYPADGTFAISTAGSERMRITSAGNVGIGTINPSEKIHVVGNVRIDGGSTAAILQTNNATAEEAGTTYRTFTTADHYAVFVDYVVYNAGRDNMRTGTFRAVWSTGDVVYTDVSTVDLGATDNVTLTAAISGANVNLIVTGPADYTLKYNLKVIK